MLSEQQISSLGQCLVQGGGLITEQDRMYNYLVDSTGAQHPLPAAVLLPASTAETAAILQICNAHRVPVTVRGGGTGVSGGAAAVEGGIVLSLERLNKILDIDTVCRTVTVQAGVVTQTLQDAVSQKGLWFPQNISSSASSFIGGNIAVSSGSPKSLKYGPTKNYVLNLEVVLPSGEVMWTGRNVTKNATGYNLTQLFAGSEGTLGIITTAVLRLMPAPACEMVALLPFSNVEKLLAFVGRFFESGLEAASLEMIDRRGYELTSAFLNNRFGFEQPPGALLWVELEGAAENLLAVQMEQVAVLAEPFVSGGIAVAVSQSEIQALWQLRKRAGDAVANRGPFMDVDVVTPRSVSMEMFNAVADACGRHNLDYTLMGHAGDGNFHVNILKPEHTGSEEWQQLRNGAAAAIFMAVARLGGSISGEHGVGTAHQEAFTRFADPVCAAYYSKIKRVFDPQHILNNRLSYIEKSKV